MKKLILIILLFIIIPNTKASECSTVELDKNAGSMEKVPVLNQGQTATCYAHTGTVMLEAYMHSKKEESDFVANPILAALLTNPDILGSGLNNFSCDAINNLVNYGNCDLKDKQDFSQLLKRLSSFYVAPIRTNGDGDIPVSTPEMQKNAQDLMCYIHNVAPNVVSEKNVNDFINILNQNNKVYYIQEAVKLLCNSKIKKFDNPPKCIGDRRIRHGGEAKSNEYRNKMHSLLDRDGAQPIGIGYCANVLMEGEKYVGYKAGFLGLTSVSAIAECGLHESVVIGRKKVGDKCFFKIRNSWGKYFYSHKDWMNENDGNVWVEENALANNMGSMSYLE